MNEENTVVSEEIQTSEPAEVSAETSAESGESGYGSMLDGIFGGNDSDGFSSSEDHYESESNEQNYDGDDADTDDTDQYLEVKHLDEVRKLNRDESKEYAQKGMDYDRIRGKLDDANKRIAELEREHSFLESLKGDLPDVKSLMIDTRISVLKDQGKSEAEAKKLAEEEFKDIPAAKAVLTAEEEQKASREKSFEVFARDNSGIKAEDIPVEVWKDVNRSGNLEASYYKHECEKMKSELDVYRRNEHNKEHSSGTSKSNGSSSASGYSSMLDEVFGGKTGW